MTRLYEFRFMVSLKRKARQKQKKHAHTADWYARALNAETLEEFDHYWTAPSFGFESSDDYYAKASSAPFLKNISVPTLAIHALDDPIVVPDCVPKALLTANPNITFEAHPLGGHMGFMDKEPNWLSRRTMDFVDASQRESV